MMNALNKVSELRGVVRYGEPMAKHTSWRVGGPADRYYEPSDIDDLSVFMSMTPRDEPILWVGLGSNLLVRDGGYRGTVISTSKMLDEYRLTGDATIYAQAGVACAHIAREVARRGFTGTEFLAGIPGTLGGALAMNAGAFGSEIWQRVEQVETMARDGRRYRRCPSEYEISYRKVVGPDEEWFISAELRIDPDPSADGERRIRKLLSQRQESQPIGLASCGSVFRNPPGDFAARLIEECGLKGLSAGKCRVSDKHANFIINDGGATAAELEGLIATVREHVSGKYGISLAPEVKIVGEAS